MDEEKEAGMGQVTRDAISSAQSLPKHRIIPQ
jgi:hypothetical protein